MPYSQYKIVRKAAELEEIRERTSRIAEMNAAFSGNKKLIDALEKRFQEIMNNRGVVAVLENTKPEPDWKERLLRFKR